jgi:hypothetical protein
LATSLERARILVDPSRRSVLETLAAHVKLHSSDEDVQHLQLSSSLSGDSIKAFTNICIFLEIEEEMHTLRPMIKRGDRKGHKERFGMILEDRMKTVKHMRLVFAALAQKQTWLRGRLRRWRQSSQ